VAVLLSVLSSLLVGVVLAIAPWTPLWDANYLLHPHPALRALMLAPFTRGAVTGLGIVNIVLAVHEAHRYLVEGGEHHA
jgi:hypothetical protein